MCAEGSPGPEHPPDDQATIAAQRQELARLRRELRESRLRMTLAVESVGGAVWEFDVVSGEATVSPLVLEIMGLDGSEPDPLAAWLDRLHPDDVAALRRSREDVLAGRSDLHAAEYRVRARDGAYRWILTRGRLLRDDDGRPRRLVGLDLDVTERKRAEAERERLVAALWESKERMRLAFAAGNAGYWSWNKETDALMVSRRTRRRLGLAPDAAITWTAFVERFVHPDDRERAREEFARVAAGTGRFESEYRLVLPDQAVRWYAARGRRVEEPPGGAERVTGVLLDITTRKRAEEDLRARTAELETVLDTVPAGVWLTRDPDAREVVGNRFAARMLRLPAGVNASLSASQGAEPRYRVLKGGREVPPSALPMQRAARGEEVRGEEFEIAFEQGGSIHILMNASPLRDDRGRVEGAVGAAVEITERKRAEQAVRARERELRLITDGLPGVMARLDLEGRYLFVNAAYLEWFRVMREEVIGKTYREVIGEEGYRTAAPFYARAYRGERVVFENAITRQGCPRRDILVTLVPDKDEAGEVRGSYALAIDITDRKRAEEQREFLIQELNHRVKNALTIVLSLAAQTRRQSGSLAEFADAFEGRLRSLAGAYGLLAQGSWSHTDLRALAELSLAPYRRAGDGSVVIAGPDVVLQADAALSLHMVFHELTTNAAKHGALSVPGGRVEITWRLTGGGEGRRLALDWTERGGPPVREPIRRGFGSTLIERSLAYELDGEARLEFRPEGLRCAIELPLPERAARAAADSH